MTNIRTTEEVAATISARRNDLDAHLRDLGEQHGAAALLIAEGNADASKQVAQLKQQMTEIRDELAALDAADRTLHKRRDDEAKAARAQEVESALATVPLATGAVEAAFGEVEAALAALGNAWKKLEGAVDQANAAAFACQRPVYNPDHATTPNHLSMDLLSSMAGKLLWQATKDSIQPKIGNFGNRQDTPEDVRERVTYALDKLAANSEMYAARSLKAIAS